MGATPGVFINLVIALFWLSAVGEDVLASYYLFVPQLTRGGLSFVLRFSLWGGHSWLYVESPVAMSLPLLNNPPGVFSTFLGMK